jgi:hypothetical protein
MVWRFGPRMGEGVKIGVANPTSSLEALVDADLGTLATALYARADDLLKSCPD